MLSKKILSLGLAGLLSASLLVGCGNNDKSMDTNNTKIEEQKFNKEVVADNEYFKMTVINKDMDEYSSFVRIQVLVENKTDKDINIYLENISVDGVMNDPAWCVEVTANNKAYSYIEWVIDSETNPNVKTVEDLKNIEGEVYVTDNNYNELFRTDINMLMTKDNVKTEAKATDKSDSTPKEDSKKSTQTVIKNTNQKEIKSTQKKSNENTTKEEPSNKHKCWLCKKNITNENFGGYSEDGTMICYRCLNKYGKDKPKEESIYDEYGYDQYGNYDPNKDLNNDREWNDEDYERWDDIHGDDEEDYDDYSEEPIQEADDCFEEETDDYYE